MELTSKIPIVFQGLPRYDHPYASTSITLAKRLSEKRLVLYVEHPLTWKDFLGENRIKFHLRKPFWMQQNLPFHTPFADAPNLVCISPYPQMPINFLPEGALYQHLRLWLQKSIWETVGKVMERFNVQDFMYINSFDPVLQRPVESRKPLLTIYHCVDNIAGERYIAKHGVAAEKEIARSADSVIVTSQALKEKLSTINPNTFLIENGVDYEHFQKKQPVPLAYTEIEGPKIVYTGNIGMRLDYAFLEKAAKRYPNFQWIFVGPINPREFRGQALQALSNVHFLGSKPYHILPAFIQHADICLIPFKSNALTRCIYPLKVNEYLAAGKPVLTSAFADLETFGNAIYRYHSLHSFDKQLAAITNGVHNTTEAAVRQAVAMGNDWSERVAKLEQLLENALIKHQTTTPSLT